MPIQCPIPGTWKNKQQQSCLMAGTPHPPRAANRNAHVSWGGVTCIKAPGQMPEVQEPAIPGWEIPSREAMPEQAPMRARLPNTTVFHFGAPSPSPSKLGIPFLKASLENAKIAYAALAIAAGGAMLLWENLSGTHKLRSYLSWKALRQIPHVGAGIAPGLHRSIWSMTASPSEVPSGLHWRNSIQCLSRQKPLLSPSSS